MDKKIILYIIAIIVILAIVVVVLFVFPNHSPSKSIDESCDGEKNPEYYAGFGIEHNYDGIIKTGMAVSATLSCDHNKITISGFVQQTISVEDFKTIDPSLYQFMQAWGLADLLGGPAVIDFNSDYNFDGYNDLSVLATNGQGCAGIDTYIIFLFDSKTNKFVYNKELSDLENVYVSKENKTIKQYFGAGMGLGYNAYSYKWVGNILAKISEYDCSLVDRNDNSTDQKFCDTSKSSCRYKLTIKNFDMEGKIKNVQSKYFNYPPKDTGYECNLEAE